MNHKAQLPPTSPHLRGVIHKSGGNRLFVFRGGHPPSLWTANVVRNSGTALGLRAVRQTPALLCTDKTDRAGGGESSQLSRSSSLRGSGGVIMHRSFQPPPLCLA